MWVFLRLVDFPVEEHRKLFRRAHEQKEKRRVGEAVRTLEGRSLLLLFEKASTRTRISFEAAIGQLGGNPITLPTPGSPIARGETPGDTAPGASRAGDAILFPPPRDARPRPFPRAPPRPLIHRPPDGR